MSIFSFKSLNVVADFAKELAQGITKDLPPKLMLNSANVVSANRVTTILERSYAKAVQFQFENNIGSVRRAILANSFRWRLRELGYPEKFIGVATEGLLVYLSKKPKKS